MKTLTILMIFLSFACLATEASEQNIYLVRHAEKASDGTRNPSLTQAGQQRANNIAKILSSVKLAYVFSTDYKRTQQTALPTANAQGLQVTSYDPRDLEKFSKTVQSLTGDILIVGHSNTTPELVGLLGGDAHGKIRESEYDRLYHLSLANGKVTTQLKRPILKVKN